MSKSVKPVEWTIWEAVVALNTQADLTEHDRLKNEMSGGKIKLQEMTLPLWPNPV